jgi:SAM-dependent methyltransferase
VQLTNRIKNKLKEIIVPSGFYFRHYGFCPCCDSSVRFEANNSWLRDNFLCSNCKSIPRERALMLTIQNFYPDWKNLKIHESSPSDRGTSMKLKEHCTNYIASQFYPDKPLGKMVDDHYNEDLENQTFQNESFDIVITQDVLEHIYDPAKAFAEIARTLRKGGSHIFTVPLVNKHKPTEVWATKGKDGNPVFIRTEEYHGNPINPKGSPVTMHWGFDIVDFIKSESGLETTIEYINNLKFGIQAEYIEVLVSKKQDAAVTSF